MKLGAGSRYTPPPRPPRDEPIHLDVHTSRARVFKLPGLTVFDWANEAEEGEANDRAC